MISLILAKKILSLFLVMALGIVLVRCGIVRSRDSKVLSMISLYLVMPCVIISSFQVKYQPEILNGLLLALATAVLLHLVLIVVVGFLGKVLKLDGVEETSLIYSNAGNLIIPIVTAILGKALGDLSQNRTIKGELYENTGRQTVCGAAAAQASGSAGQPAAG